MEDMKKEAEKFVDGDILIGDLERSRFGNIRCLIFLNFNEGEETVKPTDPTMKGYYFAGWNTQADGMGTGYADKAKVTLTDDLTLFAQWKSSTLTVEDIADQTYTGTAIEPSVTVKDGTNTLTKDTDYTLKYEDNTNAGTAKITVTGKGDYVGSGSVIKSFDIKKATPTNTVGQLSAFVGDTLFYESYGRYDLPTGDYNALRHSLKDVLLTLPEDYRLYTGHDESTTVAHERATNPINSEAEPWYI